MAATKNNILGDYEIIEFLNSVAGTDYHRGRSLADGTAVTIKTSPLRPGTQEFDRMALELRVLASIESEFIAPLLDAGHEKNLLYAVFPAHEEGKATPDLENKVVLKLVSDAAKGAHDLHQVGIVHRNIQPASVLRTASGGVLTDLGMLRSLDPVEASMTIGPIGSPQFGDPDLLRGDHRGSRHSDIWSLGATLHYLLTGQNLTKEIPDGGVQAVLRARLESPTEIDPNLSSELQAVIKACISTDTRYPTAVALSKDLDSIQETHVY